MLPPHFPGPVWRNPGQLIQIKSFTSWILISPLSQGNCRATDSTGARWCYVDNAHSSSCQDKRFSARYNKWMNNFKLWYSLSCCVPGSLTILGLMRPVPPPSLWLLAPLPRLQPSLDLWVPHMARTSPPMVTQPLDQFPLALEPVDMDLDMDLVMDLLLVLVLVMVLDLDPVLAVCMDPI